LIFLAAIIDTLYLGEHSEATNRAIQIADSRGVATAS
jgi:hypothetical protein